jgi:hypothetical protein
MCDLSVPTPSGCESVMDLMYSAYEFGGVGGIVVLESFHMTCT